MIMTNNYKALLKMSAPFIALQCYSCSTMQVKQRKKSNNKWTCVVCNEKQSMRHVFAQAHMAKDVRKFVQTFNMSRQFADQNAINDEMVAPLVAEQVKKRSDWNEYLDYDPDIGHEIEDVNEPKVVTELPTTLFKKPKLSTASSRSGNENGGNGFKPAFPKRKSDDIPTTQGKDLNKYQPAKFTKAPQWSENTSEEKKSTMSNWASKSRTFSAEEPENFSTLRSVSGQVHSTSAQVFSKWSNYMVQDKKEERCEKKVPCPFRQAGKAKEVSKWDKYVTLDEDDDIPQSKGRIGLPNRARHQVNDDGIFDVSMHEERVEEDIHPDFQ